MDCAAADSTPDMEKELTEMGRLAEGIAERARMEEFIKSIQNLMDTVGWTAQQAMDALKIPASEQKRYAELL